MPTSADIIKVIAEHLGLNAADIDKDALLQEDLGLSPIELNDLLSTLSKKFNITFEPSQVENLRKIEDLVLLVEDNLLD